MLNIPRNQPCPCGSLRHYKRCCGVAPVGRGGLAVRGARGAVFEPRVGPQEHTRPIASAQVLRPGSESLWVFSWKDSAAAPMHASVFMAASDTTRFAAFGDKPVLTFSDYHCADSACQCTLAFLSLWLPDGGHSGGVGGVALTLELTDRSIRFSQVRPMTPEAAFLRDWVAQGIVRDDGFWSWLADRRFGVREWFAQRAAPTNVCAA